MDTPEERKPLEDWPAGEVIDASSSGSSEFDDYVKVDAGEPFRAHVKSVPQKGMKKDYTTGVDEVRIFMHFELDEGPGKGQVYRADFKPSMHEKSNLYKFAKLLYGSEQKSFDPRAVVGMPIRITVTEPKGDKGFQWVDDFLKAAPDQKKVELSAEDVAEQLGGEVVED